METAKQPLANALHAGDAPQSDDIDAARRVLHLQSDALKALADGLDGRFTAAVEVLIGIKGRVTVTGMGKSGHIGRKIAATLSSTGTPAQFVHPGEASHGDMGMITQDDAIIALSNSGETKELSDIVSYSRRFSIPLIAITGGRNSALVKNADVALILPDMPEAGTLALAPTTTTTMALALGDALAVALLERNKAFTAEAFRLFHPGGKLGQQLMQVSDLMHTGGEMPLVSHETMMREALINMAGKPFGTIGVVDGNNRLMGIITDGDLRRHLLEDVLNEPVTSVMTRNPIVAPPDLLAMELLAIFNKNKINAAFIVKDGQPIGIVHVHDLLRAGIA
ncbi:MAG: KpsF/GutQ family sugar-phosphate isomerase [Alphaproteobacteria bacterium]